MWRSRVGQHAIIPELGTRTRHGKRERRELFNRNPARRIPPWLDRAIQPVGTPSVRSLPAVAAVIGPLRLDFGLLVDGVWTYRDPGQIHIVRAVHEVLRWDITALDAWLFGSQHWRNYPRVRQRLMSLRERLTPAFATEAENTNAVTLGITEYFRETRRLALRLDNVPDPLRQSMLAVGKIRKPKTASKLDAKRVSRIQQAYRTLVQSGQKYGAQTTLARQYGVSVALIRKMLLSAQTAQHGNGAGSLGNP